MHICFNDDFIVKLKEQGIKLDSTTDLYKTELQPGDFATIVSGQTRSKSLLTAVYVGVKRGNAQFIDVESFRGSLRMLNWFSFTGKHVGNFVKLTNIDDEVANKIMGKCYDNR